MTFTQATRDDRTVWLETEVTLFRRECPNKLPSHPEDYRGKNRVMATVTGFTAETTVVMATA